ncbi:MAG: hypothetical protein WCP68_14900 [Enhydrobacter sp.]
MTSRFALAIWTAVAFGLSAGSAAAASFTLDVGTGPVLNITSGVAMSRIRITGAIVEGDAEQLAAILTRLTRSDGASHKGGRIVAELSSGGGDVYASLKMGYLFKKYNVATLVRTSDLCLSACALAFLGGTVSHLPYHHMPDRSIEIGGQVGFHNFIINPNSPSLGAATDASSGLVVGFALARGGSSLLVGYAAAMSLDPAFIARLLGRPSEVWEYVDVAGQFVDLMSCATGIERPQFSPTALAVNICNQATGEFSLDKGASDVRQLTEREAKRSLLKYVGANIDSMGLQGALAKQLAVLAASRDDRQVDTIYEDLRRAGVPLPEIVGPTFEVTGYTTGDYKMQCLVSYSMQDADRYEVAIQGPGGLSKAFKTAPQQCGRLFLFDHSYMLNPQKK